MNSTCVFCSKEMDQIVTFILRGKAICQRCRFDILDCFPNYAGWKADAKMEDGTLAYPNEGADEE